MAAIFRQGVKLKEFVKKYGKVALGVHLSVSAASITGLYVAIKNNVDVGSILDKVADKTNFDVGSVLEKVGISAAVETGAAESDGADLEVGLVKRNRTAEIAASGGGAIAMAILFNKALFPLRVPITVALTPPIARFLARRRIIQTSL